MFDSGMLEVVLGRCWRLLDRAPGTRIAFTPREPLPAGCGFDAARHRLEIGRLSVREDIELVAQVLARAGGGREAISADAVAAQREDEIRTLADDPGLDYDDAVELKQLLEQLA